MQKHWRLNHNNLSLRRTPHTASLPSDLSRWRRVLSHLNICWHSGGLTCVTPLGQTCHRREEDPKKVIMSICWCISHNSDRAGPSERVPCSGSGASVRASQRPSLRRRREPNAVPTLLWSSSCFCGSLGSSSLKRWGELAESNKIEKGTNKSLERKLEKQNMFSAN